MTRLLRLDGADSPLPPLADAKDWTPESGLGIRLPVDAEVDAAWLAAPAIGVDFPAFNDGRGLSLAVLLRTRHGYQGDLIALGAVHEDLLHYLHRCGFTGFAIPAAQAAKAPTSPYSDYYQASATQPLPAWRRSRH